MPIDLDFPLAQREYLQTMDKLKAMKAFVRIVETGSFTGAAESLGVPRPQVTRLVQSLERDLRTLLLHRTTRRVALTAEGTLYFHLAVQVLEDISALESKVFDARGKASGKRISDDGELVHMDEERVGDLRRGPG